MLCIAKLGCEVKRVEKTKQASGKEGRREGGKRPQLVSALRLWGERPAPSLLLAYFWLSIRVIIGLGSTMGGGVSDVVLRLGFALPAWG